MGFLKEVIKRIKRGIFFVFIVVGYYLIPHRKFSLDSSDTQLGFIVGEFFRDDLGKFGGYGMTAKNFTDYYNSRKNKYKVQIVIPQGFPVIQNPEVQVIHNTPTLLRPESKKNYILNFIKYQRIIRRQKISLYITIDYYSSYEYSLLADPKTPVMVWIRDPRCKMEWDKIATVSLEMEIRDKKDKDEFLKLSLADAQSLHRVLKLANRFKRKIIFVTNAHCLTDRGRRTYQLPHIEPHWLPNPIPIPDIAEITFSQKPSLLFLGRLEPQKRFWIIGELAKRFKDVDFYFGGVTSYPQLMNPIIDRYANLPNVKFLGLITGETKNQLMRETWGLINTSIHEGLPVSFLETMAYGKCVISCLNPENLVERFRYFTGEFLGDGLDEHSLDLFSKKINEFLNDSKNRIEKGKQGLEYILQNHSFSNFENHFAEILRKESI